MSKLRAHNVGITSTLWPAMVCGRMKTGQRFPVVEGGLGSGLAAFIPQAKATVWEVTVLYSQRNLPQTLIRKTKEASLCTCEHSLSIPCFFSPGERPRRQIQESNLPPSPASSHHHRLAQVNKHTHRYSTSRHGRALPPLQSALISSSVCAAEDNLEAMACSRTHCLSHTAIKCTSLSGCPVSLGQEGLSSS